MSKLAKDMTKKEIDELTNRINDAIDSVGLPEDLVFVVSLMGPEANPHYRVASNIDEVPDAAPAVRKYVLNLIRTMTT